ncbi:MAG TPA: winged helix-turn-helix domain-containing protein [Sphingomicrobium sp.]|nr:winged helix-turn-helix domain-containing protein [Sphingomicrobium sp.]
MQYRVGDFEFDLRKFELRRNGQLVSAEPQVLSLLFLLIENRDRLVSKDELVATIWDGRAVSDSAISSRIKTARHIVGDDGASQNLIRTVHGKGFRFVGEVSACETDHGESNSSRSIGSKPALAVLPFACLDPELAILSDGLPHELIVGLARLRSVTVIARGSSFRFRSWPGNLSQVGRTLGVDYCLSGAVHRAGPYVAVAVELIDLTTSQVIWGDLYEGEIDKLQEVRESILAQVISTLDLQISHFEAELARLRPPEDLSAWSCYHLGLQHVFRFNRADNAIALSHFENAVTRDPGFSRAHAGVSFARFQNAFMRYSASHQEEARIARSAAETAIELDEQDPTANLMMGRSLWLEGEVESSVPWLERSIALCPSYAQAIYSRAWTHMILSQAQAGQQQARAALRLSPIDPLRYAMIATDAFTLAMLGDEAAGARLADQAAREPRAHVMIAVMAAICQVWVGNQPGARYWTSQIKLRDPTLTKDAFLRSFPFKDDAMRTRVFDAISTIGI